MTRKKVWYVGDWAVQIGPVYAETSFNHAAKGLDLVNYGHWLRDALESTGEFEVQSAKVGPVTLPQGMIPRLIQEIDHGKRPANMRSDAFPLLMPAYVSDIRIANGKVTLYKNVK